MISPTLSVVYSELVLSLYPILIKVVDTNLYTQVLARFLIFPLLAVIGGSLYHHTLWGNVSDTLVNILMNIVNLGHIAVSYLAFKILPAGTAISLFYLYPIFNVIAGFLLFGESISFLSFALIIVAFIGVYLIANDKDSNKDSNKKENTKEENKKEESTYSTGVLMGILAALTETLIFIFIRSNTKAQASPFYTVTHLYPFGLAALIIYSIFHTNLVDTSSIRWAQLIGFNALLGFTGYISRFYAISNIPTIVFSLLSFIGVIGGYLWGILFTNDKPTIQAMIGGAAIAGSIAILRYFE
jgi:drug/metabolite transporter (DMT)-like permease